MFTACWKCSNDLFFQWKGSRPCRSKCWSTELGNPKGRARENEQNRIWSKREWAEQDLEQERMSRTGSGARENEQNRIWSKREWAEQDLEDSLSCARSILWLADDVQMHQAKTKQNTLLFTHSAFALSLVVVPSVASGDQYTIQQA